MPAPTAIAIAAHPDDIEFHMGGTLLKLGQAGYETHYFCLANGCCGSTEYSARRAAAIRLDEAREGARLLGAKFHPPITNDMEVTYRIPLLRRVAAVVRAVNPRIVLTHSPADYMEDHTAACRLAVTAAFARGMPNFKTIPPRRSTPAEVTVYHAMPHGLRDPLRRRVIPGSFVNISAVADRKLESICAHRSQQRWLEESQGIASFQATVHASWAEVGGLSGRFKFAEGWRRHLHLGFCAANADPLAEALGPDHLLNEAYERALEAGF